MTDRAVWITRTRPAAHASAQVWAEAGFIPIVAPLLRVMPVEHDDIDPNSVLVFTSKNGVDHAPFRPDQPVVCVGDATAKHALETGYRNVVSVGGTSADVTAYVREAFKQDVPITHISGKHVRGSITEDLSASGFVAKRIIVYRSEPARVWPDAAITHVALYSPLAAETFAAEAEKRDVSDLVAISISAATDAALAGLNLNDRFIADRPTEAAMLAVCA